MIGKQADERAFEEFSGTQKIYRYVTDYVNEDVIWTFVKKHAMQREVANK